MLVDTELKAFGENIGISDLQFNDRGCIKFTLENGIIYLEKFENEVFFFFLKSYELSPLPYALYKKAFQIACVKNYSEFMPQVVARANNNVGLFVRLPEQNCDLPNIYKLFKFLIACGERLNEV